ncbi:MAG: hypothetical protein AB1546_01045, partial [bacterium]
MQSHKSRTRLIIIFSVWGIVFLLVMGALNANFRKTQRAIIATHLTAQQEAARSTAKYSESILRDAEDLLRSAARQVHFEPDAALRGGILKSLYPHFTRFSALDLVWLSAVSNEHSAASSAVSEPRNIL